MNRLDWIAQLVLAGVFLIAGLSKIFNFRWKSKAALAGPDYRCTELPRGLAWTVALLEIVGALALIVPFDLWRPDVLPRLAALGLAGLTLGVFMYRAWRREPAAPVMVLFLMTLFVIVARWV